MLKKRPLSESKMILETVSKKISFYYKEYYNMEYVMAPFLNYIIYREIPGNELYKSALKRFILIPSFSGLPKTNSHTFFTFPEWTARRDYQEIWKFVATGIKEKSAFNLAALRLKPAFNFKHLRLTLKLTSQITELGFKERLYLSAAMYNAMLTIDNAEKMIHISVRKYVSFSSVMGLENLLTQYFKKRGIPTYNLQHGITFLYKINIADEIQYQNIISDYQLAWGNYTRDELIKYGIAEHKIMVAGYPRPYSPRQLKNPNGRNCLVLFSRADFSAANNELMTLLARFNATRTDKFRFHCKLHPSYNAAEFRELVEEKYQDARFEVLSLNASLQEALDTTNADFCVIVNSTTYYECYMQGIPALRYKTADFDMSHPLTNDSFESLEEFSVLTNSLYTRFDDIFNAERIQKELDYVMGLSMNKYAQLLN